MARCLRGRQAELIDALRELELSNRPQHVKEKGLLTTELAARVYGDGKNYMESDRAQASRAMNKLASEGLVAKVEHVSALRGESRWRLDLKVTPVIDGPLKK